MQRESPKYGLGINNFHLAVNHSVINSGENSRNMDYLSQNLKTQGTMGSTESQINDMLSPRAPSGLQFNPSKFTDFLFRFNFVSF
jgi:hypothetical protein